MFLVSIGIGLFVITKIIPFFAFIFMDWVGIFSIFGGILILMVTFPMSSTSLLYDTIPMNTVLIIYVRRDGIIVPLLGKRIFPGESFLDVEGLGIIEDLGKDTVFLWGRKKVRFVLENISYTPDLQYGNFTRELSQIGFEDETDLKTFLRIPEIPYETKEQGDFKAMVLMHMVKINERLDNMPQHGIPKLLSNFKEREDKNGGGRKETMFSHLKQEHDYKKQQRQQMKQPSSETKKTGDQNEEIDRLLERIKRD